MKLLDRYNRVILTTTIVVMVITGVIYYGTIRWILTNQVDKDLVVEENEVFEYVKLNHRLPQVFESNDQQISFYPASRGSVSRVFLDTAYYNSNEKGYESGRGMISSVNVNGKYYKILIVESKVETEDLIRIIFLITIVMIVILLVVLLMTNRLILSRLWKPFYGMLQELKLFNLADNVDLHRVESSTDEFEELNSAIINMASRVKHDYRDLKLFTENASHELLTPIAVINSKLDTLIQTENFSDRQSKLLNDLYNAVNRLNRLNQSLLLLVKIENKVDHGTEQLNLRFLMEEMLMQFEEIFHEKGIIITHTLSEKQIYGSRYLVEILLSNLLTNAIRHNRVGGEINIKLTEVSLVVSNTATGDKLHEEDIFKRFQKSSSSEGSGLGLTISKQICENLNFSLDYSFEAPYHRFIITF